MSLAGRWWVVFDWYWNWLKFESFMSGLVACSLLFLEEGLYESFFRRVFVFFFFHFFFFFFFCKELRACHHAQKFVFTRKKDIMAPPKKKKKKERKLYWYTSSLQHKISYVCEEFKMSINKNRIIFLYTTSVINLNNIIYYINLNLKFK